MYLPKVIISKYEYVMLPEEEREKYTECDLCGNYFIMDIGGIYEEDNEINVCDECLILPHQLN